MGLFDELQNKDNFKNDLRMQCTVGLLLKSLPPAEAELLAERMADPAITYSSLSRVLTKNGYPIQDGTIARHARGRCTCA